MSPAVIARRAATKQSPFVQIMRLLHPDFVGIRNDTRTIDGAAIAIALPPSKRTRWLREPQPAGKRALRLSKGALSS